MITPESATIMKLLNMGAGELDIPVRYSMFEEVANYFNDPVEASHRILKILGKAPSKDSLESVWRFVRLQNEKSSLIKSLNPEDFEGYIASEIKQGILSLSSMNEVERTLPQSETFASIKNAFASIKEINQSIEAYG